MNTQIVRKLFLLSLVVLAFSSVSAFAQNPAQSPAAISQTPAVPARITQAIDETQLVTLKGNVHPLARPEFDRGLVADSQPLNRMLLLLQRSGAQEAALRQLLDDQQTKSSPSFRAWLTPEQFGAQFGPADADIQAVTDWLTAHGFTGIKVGPGRNFIEFSGNAGQVRRAFHTEMHNLNVNGEEHMANMSDPQIPAALSPVVAGIMSLHNFRRQSHLHKLGNFVKDRSTGEIRPLFAISGTSFQAVGPADFAKIYNIPTTATGTGQTIAIVGRSNINVQDIVDYRNVFGLAQNFTSANVVLNGPDPGLGDTETESDLDVEMSGGVAPGATLKFVTTESTQSDLSDGVDLSALYIIENNLAGVMSISFGSCEAASGSSGEQGVSSAWEQAAAQGITVVLSTGDSGSAGCDQGNPANVAQNGVSVSGFASTAFNVAVGGTDFDYSAHPQSSYWSSTNTNPGEVSANGYIPEIPWNDSCAAGGVLTACGTGHTIDPHGLDITAAGGGASIFNAKPVWQSTAITGMPNDNHRDLPDVSLFAAVNSSSNNFYVICEADSSAQKGNTCNLSSGTLEFTGVGGTSASAPAFAGIVALLSQKVGGRLGNVNYGLYALAKAETFSNCNSTNQPATGSTCVFYDITKGNIAVACQGSTTNCSSATTVPGVTTTTTGGTPLAYGTTAGYDLATGLGSVNVANLLNSWPTLTASTTTITQHPSGTLNHDTPQTFKISVTPTTVTGDVSLIAEPAGSPQVALGDATLSGSGTATIVTNILPGGTYSIIAHYSGDGTFAGSDSASVPVTVNKESSLVTPSLLLCGTSGCTTSATTASYGSAYILRVDVTGSSGTQCTLGITPCATGAVTMTDNGAPLNDFGSSQGSTPVLNNLGYLEDQPVQLSGGSNMIAAAYAGDNSYNPSSGTLTVSIMPSTTATVVAPSANPAVLNQSITLSAAISSPSNSTQGPTGNVTFKDGSTTLGTAPVTPAGATTTVGASGTATLNATFATAGTHSLTAVYAGDTNYATSTSTTVSLTVSGPDFTLTPQAPTSVTVTSGSSATYTVAVGSFAGFSSAVSLTCSVSSAVGTTCAANPASVSPGNNSTIMVATTAHQFAPPVGSPKQFGPWQRVVPLFFLFVLVLLLSFAARTRRQRFAFSTALAGVILLLVLQATGCGGGSSGPPQHGTQAGTYTVTITGMSGSSTHTAPVTLIVN